MVFSSLEFLFIFLPLFLGAYYIVPSEHRNWPLLLGSLAFYTYGTLNRPWVILLLFALAGAAFVTGLFLGPERKMRMLTLVLGLSLLFGFLLWFKYEGIFTGNGVALPLGISFYSFQMAAYLFDVYRNKVPEERSFFAFLTVMLLFPKLISGPLTPYGSLRRQTKVRVFSWKRFDYGLCDFVFGLGMKTLLADQIGGLWIQVQTIGFESISTPLAWMGLASYGLQLYFDFFGYSLMAIGLGRMIGFHLPKNFVLPYSARSMTEFWRRWHITLGKWFLDYVYIPLGGNRAGRWREIRNLLVVWLLTGIWHGSTVNFLLWGLFLFLLITNEKLWLGKHLEKSRVWSHVYLIVTILLSWMLFAISDLSQIACYLTRLFPFGGEGMLPAADVLRIGKQYGLFLLAGIAACTPAFARWWDKIRQAYSGIVILVILFWLAVYCLSAGLNDPFLYFSF